MVLTPCAPCDCIPANIPNEVFKQDVITLLCAIYNTEVTPSAILNNNEWLQSRDFAGTGLLDLLKGDTSNNTVLNALTGKKISFEVNEAEKAFLDSTGFSINADLFFPTTAVTHNIVWGDAGVTAAQELRIHSTTPDGDDDGRVGISGGGSSFSSARGGQINSYGNEHATKPGWVELTGGNVTGSNVVINCNISTGEVDLQIAGITEVAVTNTVVTLPTNNLALTAGDVLINGIGKSVQVKSGSNAKSGTFVASGITGTTVSTTAITANSVVCYGLKTVGGTIAGKPYESAVTPGTSFVVKAGASDTSTYNYVILDLI